MPDRSQDGRTVITNRNASSGREQINRGDYGRSTTTAAAPINQTQAERDIINTRTNQNVIPILNQAFGIGSYTQGNTSAGSGVVSQFPKNTFEVLADAFKEAFGQATYQPPLQSQAYGYTPVSGSGNATLLLILAAAGFAVYYFFIRNKG